MSSDKKFSSGTKSASELIYEGPCYYYGFTCISGSSFSVKCYDSLTATGTEVEDYVTDANKEMDGHEHHAPVLCRTGLYLSLGGGSAIVYYRPQTGVE